MSAARAELLEALARALVAAGDAVAELARLEGASEGAAPKPPARPRRRSPPTAAVPSLPPVTDLGRARARAILRRQGVPIAEK